MKNLNIIIVDDDRIVSTSLKTIVESNADITVIEVGNSGEEAIQLYRKHKPDVLLMDIHMGGISGLEAGEIILKEDSSAKILYLTTFSDDEYIVKALNIGAKGYILKQDFSALISSLKAVMNGQSVFGDTIINKIESFVKGESRFDFERFGLTEKENSIIELVAEGLNNKEISAQLFLGEGTVRNYISVILEKLNLRDRTQLVVFYYKQLS